MKEKLGIIGHGIVGQAIARAFFDSEICVYDKYQQSESLKKVCEESEFIFICLPTPMKDGKIDLSIIDENIKEISNYVKGTTKIVVIKSTVVPGTTLNYEKQYPEVLFAFNPEFLREATFVEDSLNPDRTVIGANNAQVSLRLLNLYKKKFPTCPIYKTDTTTAEMVKYTSNCLLATLVIYNNIIYDICQKLEVNYNEMIEMVKADSRFKGLNYFKVTSLKGFGGKCLPKDLVALIGCAKDFKVDVSFLEKVWSENLRVRKIRDWEKIPFAVSGGNNYVSC